MEKDSDKNTANINEVGYLKEKLLTINNSEKLHLKEKDNTSQLEASIRKYRVTKELQDSFWEINLPLQTIHLSKSDSTFNFDDNEQTQSLSKWIELIHQGDRKNFLATIQNPDLKKNDKLSLEIRLGKPSESYKWYMVRGLVTEVNDDDKPTIITGIFSDISGIKRAELDIRKSNLRLKTTIARLNNGILLEDEDRKIIITNQVFCNIFGIPVEPELLIGSDCSNSAEEIKGLFKDPALFVQRIDELLKDKEHVIGEVIEMADGRILERDFIPVIMENQYVGHLWKYRDVTNIEQSQQLLRTNEEKYRSIIANMNLGLLEVDNEDNIIYANQCFCDITGYSFEEIKSNKASDYLLKGENAQFMHDINEKRKLGISDMYEIPVKNKRGELIWLLISGAPLYNNVGEQTGSIGIHLDITAQKNLEGELRDAKSMAEESAKAKEIFLANMSHEIRTPMNAILGMSNLLQKTNLNYDQNNYLRAINTSAENLLVIINDILDLTKIESGKLKIDSITFNLKESIEQLEKMFLYKAQEKGLIYNIRYEANLPEYFQGDPYRINQILINLVGNAIKFTHQGKVSISVKAKKQKNKQFAVSFIVSDTGIGMDEGFKERLFENFSQEDPGITRKYGGTGLGLAISRRLIHLLNGDLEIESEKGRGTTITLTVPLELGVKAEEIEEAPKSDTEEKALEGLKILLVEDNEFNRLLATTLLTNHGAQVTEASEGKEATGLVKAQSFDIILMDIQMPVMNGYDSTKYIREHISKTIPIIAQTANAVKGEDVKCFEAGMDDYITKPFDEEILIGKILKAARPEKLRPIYESVKEEEIPTELYSIQMLEEMSRGDINFIKKMLQTVVDTLPEELKKLNNAYQKGEKATVRAVAHKIKPGLFNLKIESAPMVKEIEAWEEGQDWEELGEKIDIVTDHINIVIEKIISDHLE
ncbi:PAS domain-containing hybrid sensor histidine kinase/response regulator [Fulvivirga ligni]|uniref:PAS domain-containing hybrid sensor histidine kinase/response regulator n=1 Tax=Fulvivirga ligni TaxID=2904246 RepID=UPI001F35EE00|nr:PAS domain-containing hybrid sensor histidine kinase/response regulator [Fulvivirga ligni]UII21340.1 ATP-binding protein [Fulvivirga ligni]